MGALQMKEPTVALDFFAFLKKLKRKKLTGYGPSNQVKNQFVPMGIMEFVIYHKMQFKNH